jgi:GNAT superfamily N-acetyltransferase
MTTIEIRPMTTQDKPALMAILRDTPEFEPSEIPVAEEVIDTGLADPECYHLLVSERDGILTGFICYGLTPLTESTWDIYWMVVEKHQRGKGIGGMLLRSAEEAIAKKHGRLIIIETSGKPLYENTRSFYTSHKYEFVCEIDDFYAPGDAKIMYKKVIS